jgi:hypothetical protein
MLFPTTDFFLFSTWLSMNNSTVQFYDSMVIYGEHARWPQKPPINLYWFQKRTMVINRCKFKFLNSVCQRWIEIISIKLRGIWQFFSCRNPSFPHKIQPGLCPNESIWFLRPKRVWSVRFLLDPGLKSNSHLIFRNFTATSKSARFSTRFYQDLVISGAWIILFEFHYLSWISDGIFLSCLTYPASHFLGFEMKLQVKSGCFWSKAKSCFRWTFNRLLM